MTEYTVLLPDSETAWEAKTPAEQEVVLAQHREFMAALETRGHKVTGGAHLAPSREAKVVRRQGDELRITDGPYAESGIGVRAAHAP